MKKLTEIEIIKILKDHQLWLDTDGREGKRADFYGANLEGANLIRANLIRANLYGANLYGTGIFTFQIKYFAFFHQSTAYPNGYLLRIGCQDYFDIDDRIARNDEICRKHEYTDLEIKLMHSILSSIKREYKI